MNHLYNKRPDIEEMILLCSGAPTTHTTEDAWSYLEKECGVIKDKNGRAAWKDPTPTGNRMIAIACTKLDGQTYDGSISYGGKKVAVFRFGKFDE